MLIGNYLHKYSAMLKMIVLESESKSQKPETITQGV